jgi:hypothetical protein
MSVMQVPRLIAPGLTLGAALSNSTGRNVPAHRCRSRRAGSVSGHPPSLVVALRFASRSIDVNGIVIAFISYHDRRVNKGATKVPSVSGESVWDACARSHGLSLLPVRSPFFR